MSINHSPGNPNHAKVAIVGGGLSGLYAASLLAKKGIDYVLLEARQRLGGRIESSPSEYGSAFDLGPTWFWPALQPQFETLH